MKLLFKREQTAGRIAAVQFKLWAKIELEGEETAVVSRYGFDKALLVGETDPDLIRKTVFVAIGVLFVTGMLLWAVLNFGTALFFGIVAGGAAGWFFFDRNRETIYVRDLMYGRYFSCVSIIALARKEAYVSGVVAYLRQVMESAKHWGGEEIIDIPALDSEAAKLVMVKGRF